MRDIHFSFDSSSARWLFILYSNAAATAAIPQGTGSFHWFISMHWRSGRERDCHRFVSLIPLDTRQLAMDDDLKEKATEFIQKNFNSILDTREFHAIPTIKSELIGQWIDSSRSPLSSWPVTNRLYNVSTDDAFRHGFEMDPRTDSSGSSNIARAGRSRKDRVRSETMRCDRGV